MYSLNAEHFLEWDFWPFSNGQINHFILTSIESQLLFFFCQLILRTALTVFDRFKKMWELWPSRSLTKISDSESSGRIPYIRHLSSFPSSSSYAFEFIMLILTKFKIFRSFNSNIKTIPIVSSGKSSKPCASA